MGSILILIGMLLMLEPLVRDEVPYAEIFANFGRNMRKLYGASSNTREFKDLLASIDEQEDRRNDEIAGKLCVLSAPGMEGRIQ